MDSTELVLAFEQHHFDISTEQRLQDGIEEVLRTHDLSYEREVRLSGTDRIDFLVGGTGIEIKIQGSLSAVLRQMHRYAQHERIAELILVTSRLQLARMPQTMNGKPVRVAALLALAL